MKKHVSRLLLSTFLLIANFLIIWVARKHAQPNETINACKEFTSAQSSGNKITLFYNGSDIRENILEHISIYTIFLHEKLILTNMSFHSAKIGRNFIQFSVFLPGVGDYPSSILCSNVEIFQTIISSAVFLNDSVFSQIKCSGDSDQTRYCELRNVALGENLTVNFAFPQKINFPPIFFPSPPKDNIIRSDPIPSVNILQTESLKATSDPILSPSYLFSRSGFQSLATHYIFEFLVPFYKTINAVEGSISSFDRRIFLADGRGNEYEELFKVFSDFPAIRVSKGRPPIRFRQLTIGLHPIEYEAPKIPIKGFENYKIDRLSISNIRNLVISRLFGNSAVNRTKRGAVVFSSYFKRVYEVVRLDLVIDELRRECSSCDVRMVDFSDLSIIGQIDLARRVDVIVGIHGPSLANTLWMEEYEGKKPVLLELLPYKMWCRRLYEELARLAGADYHSVMNTENDLPFPRTYEQMHKLTPCWDNASSCFDAECQRRILSTAFEVEAGVLSAEWRKVVNSLPLP